MISPIYNFICRGQQRSILAKKNIIVSFGFKGLSIIISLIFVPLILGYLDAERYGIWLTISSIVGWISFFDIGLGNGLRNRLTEAIAKEDYRLAKVYVSTTYAILGIILLFVLVIFNIINIMLNWQIILNTTTIKLEELTIISAVVFSLFILQLFFKLIGNVVLADQKPAINNAFMPLGNLLALIIIFILKYYTEGSLLKLSFVLSSTPLLILIIATIVLFKDKYKNYRPNIRFVDMNKSKELFNLGIKFFYLQIAALVFYSSTNLLIAQVSDPKAVTVYNVAYKYFFLINMLFSIILTPIWSAVTDAFIRNDFIWLKKILRKLNLLSIAMSGFILFLLFISDIVFDVWIGNKVKIPFNMSFIIALYCISQVILAPFSSFINGLGKLRLSLYTVTIKLVIYIPMAILLGHFFGAIGIVVAMLIIQIPSIFFEYQQVNLIINRKAKGIWNH